MKRVGILGIQHESNTFLAAPTELADFHSGIYAVGEEVRTYYKDAHHEVGGFLEELAKENIEAVPLLMTFALPAGAVSDHALATLWDVVLEQLKKAGKLDGILAAPHGAGVNESRTDMDGWWLGELRKLMGPEMPIIAVIDPHANLTPAMVGNCDAVIAYRENPHIDQRQRGLEAARLMVRTLRGEIKPTVDAAFSNMAINIERQLTTAEPMLSIFRELEHVRNTEGVLSASLLMGYPYADVPEMGSAFMVVTDNNPALAKLLSKQLSDWLWENREVFRGDLISPEEAVRRAVTSPKPVGLLDMGDNMGGGAPSDSTVITTLCHTLAPQLKTFSYLLDPESVQQAEKAGVGAKVKLRMGGKTPSTPAPPFEAEVTVLSLHDGFYEETQPRHGGFTKFDMGPTALVKTDTGITIMLSSKLGFPTSANQLYSCGLDPEKFDIIILKGVHSPIAAYEHLCKTIIRVNTPGVTTAAMEELSYSRRRKPLFPFEEVA
ncbi:MAG: M81 family metallopeptidase [Chthoniobacterales bacterium]